MIWIAIAGVWWVIGWWVTSRMRKKRQSTLISLVGLLKEPVSFDAAVLARVAATTWNADLGDGSSPGADGFVVGGGVSTTIAHDNRMFLINCIPRRYAENVEKVAARIKDLRVRNLFRQHEAWFSCDALGAQDGSAPGVALAWYQRLGPLFAELLDENCLLIFLPESGLAFPVNEDTEQALRSDDPVAALLATLTLPIVRISDDDPLMKRAVEQARESWPQFVGAFEERAGENFSVKAPLSYAGNTEFIWITVTGVEGERVFGTIANVPGNLGSLKLGSKVSVPVAELNDWCYLDPQQKMVGGFTIEALQKAQGPTKKRH